MDESFCGCCGRSYYNPSDDYEWCGNCAGHVDESKAFPWDRTFRAVTGKDCPYQVNENGL